jgi:hypothetical protein
MNRQILLADEPRLKTIHSVDSKQQILEHVADLLNIGPKTD